VKGKGSCEKANGLLVKGKKRPIMGGKL